MWRPWRSVLEAQRIEWNVDPDSASAFDRVDALWRNVIEAFGSYQLAQVWLRNVQDDRGNALDLISIVITDDDGLERALALLQKHIKPKIIRNRPIDRRRI